MDAAPSDRLQAVEQALKNDLTSQGGAEFVTKSGSGPFGTTFVEVRALEGLYPGQNSARALVDAEGRTYGTGRGIQEFLEDHQLWQQTPSTDEAVQLVAELVYNGGLILDSGNLPSWRSDAGDWVLELVSRDAMSGDATPTRVTVPRRGDVRVEPLVEVEPEPIPIDATSGLVRALDSGDPGSIMAAITGMGPASTGRERAALVRAACLDVEAIVVEALDRLPEAEDAKALAVALAGVDARVRDAAIAIADELFGADYASVLKG